MVSVSRHSLAACAIAAFGLFAACGEDPVSDPLTDGVMATFVAQGDTFLVWITDEQARNDVVAVWNGIGNRSIPDGSLNLGPGPSAIQ